MKYLSNSVGIELNQVGALPQRLIFVSLLSEVCLIKKNTIGLARTPKRYVLRGNSTAWRCFN